jgi:hypothetical protein
MGDSDNRAPVERFWTALEQKDFDAAGAELHDDFSETYPQSGERIQGRDNYLGLLKAFPGFPDISVRRHVGSGELWVTHAVFDYGHDGATLWEICEVQEMREGRIWRTTAFFGAPFEAADWRRPFVEPVASS